MLDRLTDDQRKVLLIWLFVGIFIVILFFVISNITGNNGILKKDEKEKRYTFVKDYNRYYTITNIIDKYYSAINNEYKDDLMVMLNDDYIKKNDLTNDNVISYLKKDKNNVSFHGALMCKKKLHTGVVSYYVSGNTIGTNTGKTIRDSYFEVIQDENNMTFDIKEIDAVSFGDECHE